MEHASGGDVFDRIVKMTHYTERDARDLTVKLLKAVASMHKLGIAVRFLILAPRWPLVLELETLTCITSLHPLAS